MKNLGEELHKKLKKIQQVFNTNEILAIKPDTISIANYYKLNKFAYTLFHNKNFIHMGISRHKKYSSEDLLEPAKLVDKYIKKLRAKNVLELAIGRGANSVYLAKKHPDVIFEAVDLPNGQIDFAFAKARKLKNFHPREGDYHNLSFYPKNSFDLVFIIEALCYSANKPKVFDEVKRLLKNKGVFIIFDGYCGKKKSFLTKEEKMAIMLTEKGMFVPSIDSYQEFKDILLKSGFKILEEEDVSMLIIPTLIRLEHLANLYFKFPFFILKVVNKLLPPQIINNVISGYLLLTLERLRIGKYIISVVLQDA